MRLFSTKLLKLDDTTKSDWDKTSHYGGTKRILSYRGQGDTQTTELICFLYGSVLVNVLALLHFFASGY